MEITLATWKDFPSIRRSLQNKKIPYITAESARSDIENARLYLLKDNGKILGQCALTYKNNHAVPYYAIQRMVVYNKKNKGLHLAERFFSFFGNFSVPLGLTPWNDNATMKYLLKKNGFIFQYSFQENFEFWLKKA